MKFVSQKITFILGTLTGLVTLFVYGMTMSPSVGFIDSGELSSVAISLGIAHPTGYPLFTIAARAFLLIPLGLEEIVRLNIFSAVLTSLSAVVFFFLCLEMMSDGRTAGIRWTEAAAASISSMFIGFSKTFWFQALAIEVYSLHLLLILTALLLFIKAVRSHASRHWFLFAFVVGLAFTNHLTTVLLAPAMLYWFFAEHGTGKAAWKRIIQLAVPFIAGLSIYLYLPIRAAQSPLLNWGDPQSLERFWWHVTGKQFRVFMFSSSDAARRQLSYFFSTLPVEFFFPVLILAALGAAVLFAKDRRKFIFIILLFATCVGYSINYDIHDIDSYFLLAFLCIGLVSAFAVRMLLDRFETLSSRGMIIFALLCSAGIQLYNNRESVDQSSNYLVEDYTMNILMNLPANAVIISYQWDYFVAASYYYQQIKGIRPDITVIDKELLRRSWYFTQLEKMYPAVIGRSKQEIGRFMEELTKFEQGTPYDGAMIEGRYTQLLESFIERNSDRAVFVTPEIEPQYTRGYIRIPEGLVLRLSRENVYVPVEHHQYRFRDFYASDAYSSQIKNLTRNAFFLRAQYEEFHGKKDNALNFRKKASEIPLKYTP